MWRRPKGFGSADSRIAVDEDASAIVFFPDIDRLGRVESVDLHVIGDGREDLMLDHEQRGEGLGLRDLVEESATPIDLSPELLTEALSGRVVMVSLPMIRTSLRGSQRHSRQPGRKWRNGEEP